MFGTMRYDPAGKEPRFIATADTAQFTETGMPVHLACQHCRERKLKCDGQKPHCGRCTKNGHVCEYAPAHERRRRRRPTNANTVGKSSGHTSPSRRGSGASSTNQEPPPGNPTEDQLSHHNNTEFFLPFGSDKDTQMNLQNGDDFTSPSGHLSLDNATVDSILDDLGTDSADLLFSPLDLPAVDCDPGYFTGGKLVPQNRALYSFGSSSAIVPTPSTSSVSSSTCSCNDRALELIETLEGSSDDVSKFYAFNALSSQRTALRQYQHLLNCNNCLGKTTHLTLLIMVLKQMAEVGDSIVTRNCNSQPVCSLDEPRVSFKHSSYRVDTEEELRAVIQTLAVVQLKDMIQLIQCVFSSAGNQMKDSQFIKLRSAREQVKGSMARLRQGRPPSA